MRIKSLHFNVYAKGGRGSARQSWREFEHPFRFLWKELVISDLCTGGLLGRLLSNHILSNPVWSKAVR